MSPKSTMVNISFLHKKWTRSLALRKKKSGMIAICSVPFSRRFFLRGYFRFYILTISHDNYHLIWASLFICCNKINREMRIYDTVYNKQGKWERKKLKRTKETPHTPGSFFMTISELFDRKVTCTLHVNVQTSLTNAHSKHSGKSSV